MYVLSNLAQLESHFFVSEFWREKYLFLFAIIEYKKNNLPDEGEVIVWIDISHHSSRLMFTLLALTAFDN